MTRQNAINQLTNNVVQSILINSCEDDPIHLDTLVRYGHKGFHNFTNKELEEEYKEVFNKEIRI